MSTFSNAAFSVSHVFVFPVFVVKLGISNFGSITSVSWQVRNAGQRGSTDWARTLTLFFFLIFFLQPTIIRNCKLATSIIPDFVIVFCSFIKFWFKTLSSL